MSIEIEVNFINKANVAERFQINPEKFRHLSQLVQDLLNLQIVKPQSRKNLKFFIENHKFLVIFDENNKQSDWIKNDTEQELVKGLSKIINQAHEYYNLITEEGIESAKQFNLSNSNIPARTAKILSKLEEDNISLVAGNTNIKLPRIRKLSMNDTEHKKTSLEAVRITRPELIEQMAADFLATIDKKKIIASLVIPKNYEKFVCEMAINKTKVDIEFEYSEQLKKSNHYNGTLTSIKVSKIIDTIIELDF